MKTFLQSGGSGLLLNNFNRPQIVSQRG